MINGKTKALITVDIKDCLRAEGIADDGGSSNTENGYMNSTNTNTGGWKSSARRKWCNGGFYQALPSYIRSLVKPVKKFSGVGGGNSSVIESTSDYIFLPSEIEIFGTTTYSVSGEGSQYSWFNNATANRYKLPKWYSSSVSDFWWERSPRSSYDSYFCAVDIDGSAINTGASVARGLAPAWAL